MRTIVFRIATLALLLLLALMGALSWRTMQNLPDSIIYFVKQAEDEFELVRVGRDLNLKGEERLLAIIEELRSGPKPQEEARELKTSFPSDANVLSLEVIGETIHINLSEEFESGHEVELVRSRLCQLLYTLTQPKSITSVNLRVEDRSFDNLGMVVENLWSRENPSPCPIDL